MRPAPIESTSPAAATEGPHVAHTPRQRNILLWVIFVPVVGALLAWLRHDWPTWARVIATLWTLLVLIAAIGLATDVFVQRQGQNPPHSAALLIIA